MWVGAMSVEHGGSPSGGDAFFAGGQVELIGDLFAIAVAGDPHVVVDEDGVSGQQLNLFECVFEDSFVIGDVDFFDDLYLFGSAARGAMAFGVGQDGGELIEGVSPGVNDLSFRSCEFEIRPSDVIAFGS